ncbi:MAG: hypothetical protein AAGU75_11500 [Bacillota bacterium]
MPNNEEPLTSISQIENLTLEEANTLLTIQRLWIDGVQWARSFYISVFGNLPDQNSTATRLFQQLTKEENFNEFKKYLDAEELQKYMSIAYSLVAENWNLAYSYQSKNKAPIELSTAKWYKTTDELIQFLVSLNKYYDEFYLKFLLYDYNRLKIDEINALLNGDYDLEIKIYDQLEDRAVSIANYISMGLIAERRDLNQNNMETP